MINDLNQNKKNKFTIIDYALFFVLFYSLCGYAIGQYVSGTVIMIVVTMIAIAMFIYRSKLVLEFNIKILTVVFLMFLIIFLGTIVVGDDIKSIILTTLYIIATFFIVSAYKEDLLIIFAKFMLFLCIFALALWLAFLIAPDLVKRLPYLVNSKNVKAYTIIFSTIYPAGNMVVARNQGIFWEPGAFQTFINIALMIVLFSHAFKSKRKYYAIIFVFTLLTTFSTTGYVTGAVILLSYFINESILAKSISRFVKIILIASIVGIVLYVVYTYLPESAKYQLFGKIEDYSSNQVENSSVSTRFESVTIAFNAFLSSPIFGVGIAQMDILGQPVDGMTVCTPLNWFAYFGIFLGLLCNVGLFKLTKCFSNNILIRIMIFIAIMLSISTESYWRNSTILMFVVYGWVFVKNIKQSIVK